MFWWCHFCLIRFFFKFEGSKADYKSSAGCVVPDPIRFHARHWSLRHCFFLYVTSIRSPSIFLELLFCFLVVAFWIPKILNWIFEKKRNNEKGSSWVRCCVDLVWLVIQRLNLKLIFVLEEKLGINYHEFMLFWIEISVWVLIKFTLCNEVGHWKNFVGIVVRLIT